MSTRLPAQFKIAFIRLGVFGCLMALLGLFALGYLFKEYMVRDMLQREAAHALQFSRQQTHVKSVSASDQVSLVLPNVNGRVPADAVRAASLEGDAYPAATVDRFLQLERDGTDQVGFGRNVRGIKVVEGPRTALVLKDIQYVQDAFYRMMALITALVVLTFGLVTWQTYLSAKRMLRPIQSLSDEVKTWRPGELDPASLLTLETQSFTSAEARNLWTALQGLAVRVNDFVRRERDFLRDASHELRTPLTVIRVAGDMLRADDSMGKFGQRNVAKIGAAVDGIESRLQAMMLLTREQELARLSEPFDVAHIVHDQVEHARAKVNERALPVRIDAQSDPVIHGSPQAMGLILEQLLSNALQFTEEGEVAVYIFETELQVCDTGIGMSDEEKIRAFDPLFRGDPSRNANSGMGLTLVRQLAERAGWNLELRSDRGEGTCVILSWPPETVEIRRR